MPAGGILTMFCWMCDMALQPSTIEYVDYTEGHLNQTKIHKHHNVCFDVDFIDNLP